MPAYTFIDSDLLNTAVLPDEPDKFIAYTTRTTSSVLGPKATVFLPSVNDLRGTLEGKINWSEETFSIAGVVTPWEEVKTKPDGVRDSTREWHWIGTKYWVKYHNNVWMAKIAATHYEAATFTLRKTRVLQYSTPAVVQFEQDISSRDRLFLIMVFVLCETKRQERKGKAVVGVAAGHLAAEVPPRR